MPEIFFVTHFPVQDGPDPDIVCVDIAQINAIILRFPSTILSKEWKKQSTIICGSGLRHLKTAGALGLLELESIQFSDSIGSPTMILPNKKVLFAGGFLVDEDKFSSSVDDVEIRKIMFQPLKNGYRNSIVITDPYIVKVLGGEEPGPGELFQYTYQGKYLYPYRL